MVELGARPVADVVRAPEASMSVASVASVAVAMEMVAVVAAAAAMEK